MIPTKDYIDGLVRMLRIEAYGDLLDDYNPVEDYEDNGAAPNLEFAMRRHAVQTSDEITDLMFEEADYEAALGMSDLEEDDGFPTSVLCSFVETYLAAGAEHKPIVVCGIAVPDRWGSDKDSYFAGALLENLGLAECWSASGEACVDVELTTFGAAALSTLAEVL